MVIPAVSFFLRYWRPVALAAAAAALWLHGHDTGAAQCEARHAEAAAEASRAAFRAAEEASKKEAARLEAEAARDALARELEDLANADPVTDGCGLPADRVRRLLQR